MEINIGWYRITPDGIETLSKLTFGANSETPPEPEITDEELLAELTEVGDGG